MEKGYIRIKENNENQLIIEAKLVNCTLWMTKHEIADLFNVFVNTVGNNLRSIFKSGLLREENSPVFSQIRENKKTRKLKHIYEKFNVISFYFRIVY
jgi:hypothetical protein